MSTPPAVKRWRGTNLRGGAGAGAAFSPLLSPGGLSPLGASSARTAAVVETNRVNRMASVALRMRRISLMVSHDIRLERAEVSGFRRGDLWLPKGNALGCGSSWGLKARDAATRFWLAVTKRLVAEKVALGGGEAYRAPLGLMDEAVAVDRHADPGMPMAPHPAPHPSHLIHPEIS